MIVGVGVDFVEVERLRRVLARYGARARQRLFTTRELSDCESRLDPGECLAARFAAKEAALKALGTGKSPGIRWTDMEVIREGSGRPRLELSGEAHARAARLGAERAWVSLSHEAGLACAVVLLEAPKT
ncbi:MAG: holo-ACP synthase [Gemmatimonadota bacterium]|nr:MAG: holo-ACP synthase [Gemmatimonadota bacterium]